MFTSSRSLAIRLLALVAVVSLAASTLIGHPARSSAKTPAAAAVSAYSADDATKLITGSDGVLRFETAEDHTRYVWAGDPPLTDGLPDHDTPFIAQGYIYPAGTLTGTDGVLPDGSPEFPDKVLGQWTCYGWWVGAGERSETAPWVSTHVFNFGGEPGKAMLLTTGYDVDDLVISIDRAVTGGSGPYEGARGVQAEVNLGYNATNGINIRYEVRLAGA
jgi:hypothetical protein